VRAKTRFEQGKSLTFVKWQQEGAQEWFGFETGLERNFISLIELGRNQPTITTLLVGVCA